MDRELYVRAINIATFTANRDYSTVFTWNPRVFGEANIVPNIVEVVYPVYSVQAVVVQTVVEVGEYSHFKHLFRRILVTARAPPRFNFCRLRICSAIEYRVT